MNDKRAPILARLHGERPESVPAFSGLAHVTTAGAEAEGLEFHRAHSDPHVMARLAASTFRLAGLPSAAVPFDLCVEAEALGAEVAFPEAGSLEFPRVLHKTSEVWEEWTSGAKTSPDFRSLGRIPLVCQAIAQLKTDIGGQAVIGGILAGPFTVLSMLAEPASLFAAMKQQPEPVLEALFQTASFIAEVGKAYREAGADFVTIHEMGGSPALLGARRFEQFVLPALKRLIADLPSPRVLAVCGAIGAAAPLLEAAEAEAVSIDQANDLRAMRLALPTSLLFGNVDPVETLAGGTPAQVRETAARARLWGADAIWPGCDLLPRTPLDNLRALAS
ncbi:MAG TPA: uroporphyrinogen decarboxylase family protein [Anaerolineales bacterium]